MHTTPLKVLSIIPPMTQLNTPYPSSAYLTGFLRSRSVVAVQEDLALALVLELFSASGLLALRDCIEAISARSRSTRVKKFYKNFKRYHSTIDLVIKFLQGADSTLAHRIVSRSFLPEGSRFVSLDVYELTEKDEGQYGSADPLAWAFGALGTQDKARHFATLYLNDIADVLREAVDVRFEFVRYAESLAGSQPSFDPLDLALQAGPNLIDITLQTLSLAAINKHQPTVVLLSVPFPGSVYAAFRIAQSIKAKFPKIITVLGGGYVNTELRELQEPRVFDYFDYVTLDSGEQPLWTLLEHLQGKIPVSGLVRTYIVERNTAGATVRYINPLDLNVPFAQIGTPTWDGLPLTKYLSLLDMLNPMHRLWSEGRWNKLTIAQGCYWKKCSFCDVTLDYISRYETASASLLVNRIRTIISETHQSGFHFVDEAAPPKALKSLALELLKQSVSLSWWGNIRFEKSFTPELCATLAQSGCIAISGGLEVASDRLLSLMQKGVSVAQVARVTKSFSDAGILVHAYLMYGFPTQSVQETVDSLEYVRQLFLEGCIQSGFFHRFTCTVHSPVGLNPDRYGVTLAKSKPSIFAKNDIVFFDPSAVDHDELGRGLNKGLYNYMHGVGLDRDVREWFKFPVPRTTVKPDFIAQAII